MRCTGIWVVFLAFLFLVGCGESRDPIASQVGDDAAPAGMQHPSQAGDGNRVLWGLWKVSIPADRSTVDVVPDRAGAMHLNVVRLLEVNPCTTCLSIQNVQWLPDNIIQADLRLRHPFPGIMRLTGFDVRGIFISEGNYEFPESERLVARGTGVPRMLDPDGYTSVFNPTEFPEGSAPFPILAYITGRFSNGGDLSGTLNPYVAYGVDNPRRIFEAGSVEARTVQIYYPDLPMEFGYAVDASWVPVDDVVDPVTDFPPEANCMEAYRIGIQGGESVVLSGSEPEEIFVEVFDHQGLETISSVSVEAPDLFAGVISLDYSEQSGPDSWLFGGEIAVETCAPDGVYPVLVRVEDTVADPNLGRVDTWGVFEVSVVGDMTCGWARTWGGAGSPRGFGIAVDGTGSIYVTGLFFHTVEFDPDGGDPHTSNGDQDVFLSKFDSSGNYEWTRTWGGPHDDYGYGIAADSFGNVYVTGYFNDMADFDPDGGDPHTSSGSYDAFLSKFDSSGNFEWARTWGGPSGEAANGVAADSLGNAYVIGGFWDTADFDPNGGDPHTSNGLNDVFLSKFNSTGSYLWVRTWGGSGYDNGNGVAADGSGNVCATGCYQYKVDFNPGGGDPHTSNGNEDVFLSKFDSSGHFMWARTWGGPSKYGDWGHGVTADSSGNVHVTGGFWGTADFDPGGGEPRTSNGLQDIFLSRFDSSGNFKGVRTWGGPGSDDGYGVAADISGYIYVTGVFSQTVDFNPTGGDPHTSNGMDDMFLSKFNSLGDFEWARTWGGTNMDGARGVAVDGLGNAYTTGWFVFTVDFAPTVPPCNDDPDVHTSEGDDDSFLTKHLPDGCW